MFCSARPHACAVTMVDTVKKFTQSSVTEGVAALYAYEVQQPGVAREKVRWAASFLRCGECDRSSSTSWCTPRPMWAHSQGERAVLTRCLDGSDVSERILSAATDTLDAYCGLLDGICRTTGVATA